MKTDSRETGLFFNKKRSEDEEPIVWLSGHPKNKTFSLAMTDEFKKFANLYWPCTEHYHNPLGAVFSTQALSEKVLAANTMLLFRDGLIPLLWFFKLFPHPKSLKTTFFVPSRFARAVPSAWLRHVKFYTVVQVANPLQNPEVLYVLGNIGTAHTDIRLVRSRVEKCKDLLGERISKIEKRYLLAAHSFDPDCQCRFFETFQILFSEFGFDGRPITWAEYNSSSHSTNCVSLSLNSDLAVYDDFTIHTSASKGTFQIHLPVVDSISKIQIPLSPYHGLNIRDSIAEIEEARESILTRNEIMSVFGHDVYLRAPWPSIFSSRWT